MFGNITQIQQIAYTDQLTQIANRLKIDDMLDRCTHSSKRYRNIFSVILIEKQI